MNKPHKTLRILIMVLSVMLGGSFVFGQVEKIDKVGEPNVLRKPDALGKPDSIVEKPSIYEYGKVSKSDLEMEYYPLDSSANAVYLLDKGYLGFSMFEGFRYRYHGKIKLLNKESFEMANITIPISGGGPIQDLRAMTHNLEDGKIVQTKMTKEDFIEEKIVKGLKTVTFTFPDVREGSVLEYSYELPTYSPSSYLPWYFQSGIPAVHSEFMFSGGAASFEYVPRIYGFEKLDGYETQFDRVFKFQMKDVPAFVEEPYVNNLDDYYSKVTLDLVSDLADNWEDLINIIVGWEEFGYTLDESSGIKKILPKNVNWSVDEQGLKDIHKFVANRFKWNGNRGLTFSDVPRKIWKADENTAADINLTLFMILKKVGFDVEIIFSSTSDNGLINKEIPTFRQFNYVVVSVNLNGKEILMDATSPHRPYNILPDPVISDQGMVIRGGKLRWVDMHNNKEFYSQATTTNFELSNEGKLAGHTSVSYVNASAANIRDEIKDVDLGDFDENFEESMDEFEIDSVKYEGLNEVYSPVKIEFDFSTDEFVEEVGDRLFIRPVLFREVESNPFKLEERRLPIDFTLPITKRYFFSLTIPKGYEVEELPEAKSVAFPNGGGSYTFQIQQAGDKVQVLVRLAVRNKTFFVEDYQAIKSIFDLIINKQEERIVLVKAN